VTIVLSNFPQGAASNLMFTLASTPSRQVQVDGRARSTYERFGLSFITFFAPVGISVPVGPLMFTVTCTDTRFPPSVLNLITADFSISYRAPPPQILSVRPSAVDMSGGVSITVSVQNLKVVSAASQIVIQVGPRVLRNVTVLFSDLQATSFVVADFPPSDVPAPVSVSVSHVEDSTPASFSIQYTGRQSITCLQNCAGRASEGSAQPVIAQLRNFPITQRSSQLSCTATSASSCTLQLINSSSTLTFVRIVVGPSTESNLAATSGLLVSTVTVNGFQASSSFSFSFLFGPRVLSSSFVTESSFQVSFDQNIVVLGGNSSSSCHMFEDSAAIFGSGATCSVSLREISVSGGFSFSLIPGSVVKIDPASLTGRNFVDSFVLNEMVARSVTLSAPEVIPFPRVRFIGPNTLGPCDDLELSISNPTPRARYTWYCINDPDLTAAALDRKVDCSFHLWIFLKF